MLLTLTSLLSLLGWVTATRAQVEGNNIHNKIKGRVSMHQNTHILIIIITSVRNKELDVFVLMLGRHWRRGWRKNKTITTTIDHFWPACQKYCKKDLVWKLPCSIYSFIKLRKSNIHNINLISETFSPFWKVLKCCLCRFSSKHCWWVKNTMKVACSKSTLCSHKPWLS